MTTWSQWKWSFKCIPTAQIVSSQHWQILGWGPGLRLSFRTNRNLMGWGPAPLLSLSLNEQTPSFTWRSESATDNSHEKQRIYPIPFDNIFVLDIYYLFHWPISLPLSPQKLVSKYIPTPSPYDHVLTTATYLCLQGGNKREVWLCKE